MKKFIIVYFEQSYARKLDEPDVIDKFLKIYNLPKPNHEENK